MRIDALLKKHPWPWTVESGPRRIVDAHDWPVFQIVPGDRNRDVDVLNAILGMVEEYAKWADEKKKPKP